MRRIEADLGGWRRCYEGQILSAGLGSEGVWNFVFGLMIVLKETSHGMRTEECHADRQGQPIGLRRLTTR